MKTLSKNQLKKWLTLLLGACLTLAWAGCGDSSSETAPPTEEAMDEIVEDMDHAADVGEEAIEDAADDVSDGY